MRCFSFELIVVPLLLNSISPLPLYLPPLPPTMTAGDKEEGGCGRGGGGGGGRGGKVSCFFSFKLIAPLFFNIILPLPFYLPPLPSGLPGVAAERMRKREAVAAAEEIKKAEAVAERLVIHHSNWWCLYFSIISHPRPFISLHSHQDQWEPQQNGRGRKRRWSRSSRRPRRKG